MRKTVSLVSLVLFLLSVTVAGAAYRLEYPSSKVISTLKSNGSFTLEVMTAKGWQNAGKLEFNRFLLEKEIDLGKHLKKGEATKVRITQSGGGAAHLDSLFLGGATALKAEGLDEKSLKKLSSKDFDLIDAKNKDLVFTFPANVKDGRIKLTARIEKKIISKYPFHFPLENTFKDMEVTSKFYNYELGKGSKTKSFFKEWSLSGSGHPSSYTYGYVSNDDKNLYVTIDFTGDNTMDGGKDYTKVFVKTSDGVKEFKVSELDKKWGAPDFTYTDKVPFEHKLYSFTIPFEAAGIKKKKGSKTLQLAFAAYGTDAPAAGNFTVDSTADTDDAGAGDTLCADSEGNCTLRAAIQEANSLMPGSVITVPAGTYTLVNGEGGYSLNIYQGMTIQGAGASSTIIQGPAGEVGPYNAACCDRIFNINDEGGGGDVTISGVTIQRGSQGGVYNDYSNGTTTLDGVTVSENYRIQGGGIFHRSGTFVITNSTITNNTASEGGGIYVLDSTLKVTNSTISGNTAEIGDGGGIYNSWGTVTLTNSTVTDNDAGGFGQGIFDDSSFTVILQNTIVADNNGNDDNCGSGPGANYVSNGNNIDGGDTCGLYLQTDHINTDPLLGVLADNGGPTQTHALGAGSPAIDAGNDQAAPATDQRGQVRPLGEASDIGAYEFGNDAPIAFTLVSPADGATGVDTTVDLLWMITTDPDGDGLTYTVLICEDEAMTVGCFDPSDVVAKKVVNNSMELFASSGIFGTGLFLVGLTFAGGLGRRDRNMALIAALIFMAAILASCASNDSTDSTPAPTTSKQEVTGLNAGTTYYWKVTADDGNGGTTDSPIQSFTTA